jgi:hypothetical protein
MSPICVWNFCRSLRVSIDDWDRAVSSLLGEPPAERALRFEGVMETVPARYASD